MAGELTPSNSSFHEMSPCKNKDKGCQWRSFLGNRETHIKTECKFEKTLKCKFCNSIFASDELDAHQNLTPTNDNWKKGCQKATLKCIYCEDMIKREQLDEHLNESKSALPEEWLDGCQNVRIKCIHCDEVLERQQMTDHLDRLHKSKDETDYGETTCTLCKGKFEPWQLKLKKERENTKAEEKHLGLVIIMAWQAHEKWHELGSKLDIDSSKLHDLSVKHNGSTKECFAEMIYIWLAKKSTYKEFIHALRSVDGLRNVADSMDKSIQCEEVMTTAGKIKCIFCDREVQHHLLSSHIKLEPENDNWLAGCDRAKEKLTEGSNVQVKRKRGRDEESNEQNELPSPKKLAKGD